jgi:hypothetical protein
LHAIDCAGAIRGLVDGTIVQGVPIIAVFFGIVIRMFCKEHDPGHFHAEHQGLSATFDFGGKMRAGNIQSKRALRLIREWGDTASSRTRGELGDDESRKASRQDCAPALR